MDGPQNGAHAKKNFRLFFLSRFEIPISRHENPKSVVHFHFESGSNDLEGFSSDDVTTRRGGPWWLSMSFFYEGGGGGGGLCFAAVAMATPLGSRRRIDWLPQSLPPVRDCDAFHWVSTVLMCDYGFLLGFTEFYWVLLGFTVVTEFYWVLHDFIWFDRILLGFIWFYWVLLSFASIKRLLQELIGTLWLLLGLTGFILGFNGFYLIW